jgi:methylmalonyl-CoA mutase cobalamin-binding domain/chain
MPDFDQLVADLTECLLGDDDQAPVAWARQMLTDDLETLDFFQHVFTPALTTVGDRFGRLEIFLPELIEAAERAQAISRQVIQPRLAQQGTSEGRARGKVVICSVQGDLHDIGKNMVSLMLQVNNFEVVDLGIDVPPRTILQRAREEEADIVGLSSLMTTSMPYMKEVVELRDGFGLDVAVVVGGAPITPDYSAEIGADGFGRDAMEGVRQCIEIMERRPARRPEEG